MPHHPEIRSLRPPAVGKLSNSVIFKICTLVNEMVSREKKEHLKKSRQLLHNFDGMNGFVSFTFKMDSKIIIFSALHLVLHCLQKYNLVQ